MQTYRLSIEWLNGGRVRVPFEAPDFRSALDRAADLIDALSRTRGRAVHAGMERTSAPRAAVSLSPGQNTRIES